MDALKQILNRFQYSISQRAIFLEIMRKPQMRKWIIEQLIQKEQLQKGRDEDGDIIGYYSELTEKINPRKAAGTPYTLKDTGQFYKSMYIRVNSEYIEIDADPIKVGDDGERTNLFWKYGEGIIGLTEQSRQKLINKTTQEAKIILQRLLLGP
jgi:hypothetical protein